MTIYRGPGGTGEARTDTDVTEVRIIADEAEGYKDAAAASAMAAASSAAAALSAETNAELAETNAETAETNAEAAQVAAEAALASAQAVYDNFDDRYLGPKASDPTLDNDGNALLTGALYFNTTVPEMRVYTGSAWVDFSSGATVSSFNTRTGAVTLTSSDVTTALTYTPLQTETDPVYLASSWYGTTNNSSNWNTAYGWGNHASAGYAADSAVVHKTGDETIAGTKTFSSTITGSITGNAGTVTNGVYTTGSYADPSWLTSLAWSKVTSTPTTIAGYGITNAYTKTEVDASLATKQAADTELTTLAGMSSSRATFVASNEGFGFRNRIINGDMRIDQRNAGASVTVTGDGGYTLDRWTPNRSGTINNFTCQQVSVVPAGFSNSMLFTMGTGVTPATSGYAYLSQSVEGLNSADLGFGTANAATVTLSFWVRSSVTGTFGVGLRNSSGGRSYISSYTISSANTWEQKSVTIAGDTSGTWLTNNGIGIRVDFDLGVGPTYSTTAGSWQSGNFFGLTGGTKLAATTGATFYITGVQLEAGSVASPFERRDYGRELMMCQRYYEKGNGSVFGNSTATWGTFDRFCVTKRAAPTVTVSSGTVQNVYVDGFECYASLSSGIWYLHSWTASIEL